MAGEYLLSDVSVEDYFLCVCVCVCVIPFAVALQSCLFIVPNSMLFSRSAES